MKAPLLESDNLIYKPVSLDHLSQNYVNWLNDFDVYKYMETGGNYTIEELKSFLIGIEKKQILFWAIHLKHTDQHIGNIKIDPINIKHNTAEYGIMIGEKEEWGKGYAKEATLKIINYCFEELGIRKITLGLISENLNALKLYEKIGFETEGKYKSHVNYHNTYYDVIRMALFNSKL
jgi:ribosomal-protein-alanine N-acetyltransferase